MYTIANELVDGITLVSAYTPSGDYIGDLELAHKLCYELGIVPEKADPAHSICTIGYSERQGKWFGWSHRAMCGFGVGDTVKEGDVIASQFPVDYVCESLSDAKTMAIVYADFVG